jgi:hypothetical protein
MSIVNPVVLALRLRKRIREPTQHAPITIHIIATSQLYSRRLYSAPPSMEAVRVLSTMQTLTSYESSALLIFAVTLFGGIAKVRAALAVAVLIGIDSNICHVGCLLDRIVLNRAATSGERDADFIRSLVPANGSLSLLSTARILFLQPTRTFKQC